MKKRQNIRGRRRLARGDRRKGKDKKANIEEPKEVSTILILRNEFKWDDWIAVNEWLGQEEGKVTTYPSLVQRNTTNEFGIPVNRELSEEARSYLCNAIVEEYRIYFSLLEMAANLDETDVRMSYEKSRENCPNLFNEHGSFIYS